MSLDQGRNLAHRFHAQAVFLVSERLEIKLFLEALEDGGKHIVISSGVDNYQFFKHVMVEVESLSQRLTEAQIYRVPVEI